MRVRYGILAERPIGSLSREKNVAFFPRGSPSCLTTGVQDLDTQPWRYPRRSNWSMALTRIWGGCGDVLAGGGVFDRRHQPRPLRSGWLSTCFSRRGAGTPHSRDRRDSPIGSALEIPEPDPEVIRCGPLAMLIHLFGRGGPRGGRWRISARRSYGAFRVTPAGGDGDRPSQSLRAPLWFCQFRSWRRVPVAWCRFVQ